MPLDAICLSVVTRELEPQVEGARIDKIHQPARDEIILSLRTMKDSLRLLLSANPTRPRAHITYLSKENPEKPPNFCMLLRKHLMGGRIVKIRQPSMERLVEFQIEATDALGDRACKKLILEAMGRHANLVLLDEEGRIIDCLRNVSMDLSGGRQILPGMFYHMPPSQGKENPFDLSEERLSALVHKGEEEQRMDRWLVDHFLGISPLIARELAFEVTASTEGCLRGNEEALFSRLQRLLAQAREGEACPYLLMREGKAIDFSFRPILQYGPTTENVEKDSFGHLFDTFYEEKDRSDRVRQKGQGLIQTIKTARDRVNRKLGFQKKELQGTFGREQLRQNGDIIMANLSYMEKGMHVLKTENFYDPESREISIALDPLKTPQQNAERYYKNYKRAGRAEEMLTQQIKSGEVELEYLDSVFESLSRAEGEQDLEDIRKELEDTGYLKSRPASKKKKKTVAWKPLEFRSSGGFRISVGKTNQQNDDLTMKQAGREDYWFHTQKIHGAHVILWTEGLEVDEKSLVEAAMLAGWFSQGRDGGKIPVDYTRVKYVRKPNGAKLGMVTYKNHETIYVTPEEKRMQELKRQ